MITTRRLTVFRTSILICALGVACAVGSAHAGEPRGPRFGAATISSSIRTADGEPDEDVFVESLAKGETLVVRVAAVKKSALLPLVEIEGPDGLLRDVAFKVKKGGKLVQSPKVAIDMTGTWVVRISGDGGTEGGYAAKFKIGKQKTQTFKDVAVGGGTAASVTQFFDAVEGAVASISVKSSKRGAVAKFNLVLDPGGGSVGDSAFGVRSKGAKASLKKLLLEDGNGDYGVLLTAPDGAALVTVKVKLAPPASRPRGKLVIDANEPFLRAVDEPIEGFVGKSIALAGANFDTTPRPTVWFGDLKGSVSGVNPGGVTLNVVPPENLIGATVAVEVVAPDGQASSRSAYFTYLEPEGDGRPPPATLEVIAIDPDALTMDGGTTLAFEITINEDAPPGGVRINLNASNSIGLLPPTVRVPTGGRKASFLFRAENANAAGVIDATYASSAVAARITVRKVVDVPPPVDDTIDISNWIIRQQSSSRSFAIPSNTVLGVGDYLVLGRNATKAQFESFWRVTLGDNVIYVNSVDEQVTEVPTINGSETYELLDAFTVSQDGPSIAMVSSARQNLQRTPGTDAGQRDSWSVQSLSSGAATPGSGISRDAGGNGIYISEFSDTSGTGAFIYEFVELHYDGKPESPTDG